MNKKIESLFIDYAIMIKKLNSYLILKYNYDKKNFIEDPFKFSRELGSKGSFIYKNKRVNFSFHGSGCDYIFEDGREIRYDFAPLINNRIKTSPWKFYRYIDSNYKEMYFTEKNVRTVFDNHTDHDFLSRNELGFFELHYSFFPD
ncbi:MAG: hypothetical protein N4A35_12360 [Flavobacteriales bacterium]|jgi:hypothetical protein|nr:hypothetical protein [Flavobacteriales bacterium]